MAHTRHNLTDRYVLSELSPALRLFRKMQDLHDGAHGLQELAPGHALFEKPTLLCCGGLQIHQSSKSHDKEVNGFIKIGHALLGLPSHASSRDACEVVGVSYPESASMLDSAIRHYHSVITQGKPAKIPASVQDFAAQHLFPLVQDEQGNARSLADAKRKLRNVHVLAHSYGGAFASMAGDALVGKMTELGFTPREIREATSQVLVVCAGGTLPLGAGKASFTTLNAYNVHDSQVNNLFAMRGQISDLLADAPHDMTLVVDRYNQPYRRSTPREDYQQRVDGHYPAQSFTIVPVKREGEQPSARLSSQADHYLAVVSPPLFINPHGDVIARETLNPYGTAAGVRHQPGNPAKRAPDHTLHRPRSYFHYNDHDSGDPHPNSLMLRTAMASVLTNGMNNALKNAERPEAFEALPAMKTLVKLPAFMRYEVAPDVDFRSIAPDDYNEAVTRAMIRPAQLAMRGR